jgi:hypothetical protein
LNVNSSVSSLATKDGDLAVTDEHKANILNTFFSSVFTRENITNLPNIELASRSNGAMLSDVLITPQAVKEKLCKLDASKAFGPDGIPPRVLKELHAELALPISILFNKSVESGVVPFDWRNATVTALFKKGTRSDPGNYRPVSLTSILCKVLESFIRDAIVNYMTDCSLYTKCQHGFRKGRSCTTQLLEVMEDFTKYLDDNDSFDVLYLDFKKAFDSVPHERLLLKMQTYGITGQVLQWVRNFLAGRVQRVRVGRAFSEQADVLSGIPQGSILGPILFTLFINDLPDDISSVCKIFADDTKIYSCTSHSQTIQKDLDNLVNWSDKWNLYFNAGKCKVLHYGRKNPNIEYTMGNDNERVRLTVCDEEKDLGVIFDKNLKFDKQVESSVQKANKMLGIIKRSFTYLDEDMFLRLYKSLIRPHLEYGNVIWNPYLKRQSARIESVQRRATRLLKTTRHLSYIDRLHRFDLPSLKFRRLRGDLIQTYKIFHNIENIDAASFFQTLTYTNTRQSEMKIFIKHSRTNVRKYVYANRIAPVWNKLPLEVKSAKDVNTFKNLLQQTEAIEKLRFDID